MEIMERKELLEDAKVLCSQFLKGDWKNVANIESKKLTGGYVNVLALCSLKEDVAEKNSPNKVIN